MSTALSLPAELLTALAALNSARMVELTSMLCAPDFAGRRVKRPGAMVMGSSAEQQWSGSCPDESYNRDERYQHG